MYSVDSLTSVGGTWYDHKTETGDQGLGARARVRQGLQGCYNPLQSNSLHTTRKDVAHLAGEPDQA